MEASISRTFNPIFHSSSQQNPQLYRFFKQSLLEILTSLKQQQEEIKLCYSQEIMRLNQIINEKQEQIRKLKQDLAVKEDKITKQRLSNASATPYKILLKNRSNQCILNKENIKKQSIFQNQYVSESPSLNKVILNRFSLQIGPAGFDNNKKLNRISSSNIKNKIINKNIKQDPTNLVQQNNEIIGNYSSHNPSQYLIQMNNIQTFKSPRCSTSRNCKEQSLKCLQNFDKKNTEFQNKSSSLQVRHKLSRKVSNKSKGGLFEKKKQPPTFDSAKTRCIDIKIPVKIISFSNIKPR